MGMSATAYLLYGVPLGGGEWDPTFTDHVDEDGTWTPPWADADDDEDSTVSELVDARLRAVGFSESWGGAETMGIGITYSGYLVMSGDPVLRAFELRVDADDLSRAVDFAELERRRVAEDWDGQLAAALAALEISTAPAPGWHLVASYG
ncbi:hypothetical protein ACT17_23040 [Mycolicibacterium conceptionense]|uniref:Uncharacterized protein n=1 Tax=Mycolicibacterium conceptionense TaxID=451644 RepID=A0A0J8U346_9MYCO|nr:hypothetical protein [Mycolicibacterium conceptionense]KMV15968.1 hypothetical protein ACT17_23040 [Mycolicibacterium conceptionense]